MFKKPHNKLLNGCSSLPEGVSFLSERGYVRQCPLVVGVTSGENMPEKSSAFF